MDIKSKFLSIYFAVRQDRFLLKQDLNTVVTWEADTWISGCVKIQSCCNGNSKRIMTSRLDVISINPGTDLIFRKGDQTVLNALFIVMFPQYKEYTVNYDPYGFGLVSPGQKLPFTV